jgi:hypothetical protein
MGNPAGKTAADLLCDAIGEPWEALDLHWAGEVTLGEFLVAFGTLALAFFTWRLAVQTGHEVLKMAAVLGRASTRPAGS